MEGRYRTPNTNIRDRDRDRERNRDNDSAAGASGGGGGGGTGASYGWKAGIATVGAIMVMVALSLVFAGGDAGMAYETAHAASQEDDWSNVERTFSRCNRVFLNGLPSHSSTPTSTPTGTPSRTPSQSLVPSPSPTGTGTVSSPSSTPSNTGSPSNTATPTSSLSPGVSPSNTPTNTPSTTGTPTQTPTGTGTGTPSQTQTGTGTGTPTNTGTQTPTSTMTRTPTGTGSITPTPSTTPSTVGTCGKVVMPASTILPKFTATVTQWDLFLMDTSLSMSLHDNCVVSPSTYTYSGFPYNPSTCGVTNTKIQGCEGCCTSSTYPEDCSQFITICQTSNCLNNAACTYLDNVQTSCYATMSVTGMSSGCVAVGEPFELIDPTTGICTSC